MVQSLTKKESFSSGISDMGSISTPNDSSFAAAEESRDGLGSQSTLEKIDKLQELNLSSIVPLPQLVVVGDQSSGKSSVLEGVTGFSFPRAPGLCTRYATQITCRRETQRSVSISIIPRSSATPAEKDRLREFHRTVTGLGGAELEEVFEEANRAMGIRSIDDSHDSFSLNAFSEDVLKIEISGPEENHLTVIDVPGIFRNATPGLTTETDIVLVRDMVKRYMKDSRTIILAVIPCNVDIATQEILDLAREVDPAGIRTMGVLTKPDLAVERATKQAVIDLVLGKRNDLRLGYCVVKNRNADDEGSTLRERHLQEKNFFRGDPWAAISAMGRTGVDSLKQRLRELLTDISRREFPKVKAEIAKKLNQFRDTLNAMGPSRSDPNSQRLFLGKMAGQFQRVSNCALNAYYTDDQIFTKEPGLRLITKIMELNEVLSNVFWERGHTRRFETESGKDDDEEGGWGGKKISFEILSDLYPEIHDLVLTEEYECPDPTDDSLMDHIEGVFNSSRGPELGTFGGSILATTFKEQTQKWEQLAKSHVSSAIFLVHDFIVGLLKQTFPEKQVREELWDGIVLDRLRDVYKLAMDRTEELLEIEREGLPITVNHYFNENLQRCRAKRLRGAISDLTGGNEEEEKGLLLSSVLERLTFDKSNSAQVREDIHDTLASYYKVSRKRFVDVICQQVVYRILLNGPGSPLRVISSELIMTLSESQLGSIAGEDSGTMRQREVLSNEINSLEEAVKVLRS